MSLSVKEILTIGERQLRENSVADSVMDSKLLYCYLMKKTLSQLILEWQKILPDSLCEEYFKLLEVRCTGKPVQYITGVQEFIGYEFNVNEKVLIPRQDTEVMVVDAMDIINNQKLRGDKLLGRKKDISEVLDLCCGSGAIGISLAKLSDKIKVTCSDVSKDAITIAKQNAEKLGCSNRIKFVEGNLLEPFKGKINKKKFDMIISNPPYIKSDIIPTLQIEVKDYEPMIALDGGEDGLDFYRKIISDVSENLKKDGMIIFEIGYDQKDAVIELINNTYKFENIMCLKDLVGQDRIVIATLAPKKKK